jgi:hypothetical protein
MEGFTRSTKWSVEKVATPNFECVFELGRRIGKQIVSMEGFSHIELCFIIMEDD